MLADIVDGLNKSVTGVAKSLEMSGAVCALKGAFHIIPDVAIGAKQPRTHLLFKGYTAAYGSSGDLRKGLDVISYHGREGRVLAGFARIILKERLQDTRYRLLPLLPRESESSTNISVEGLSSELMPEIEEIRRRYVPVSENEYALRKPEIAETQILPE